MYSIRQTATGWELLDASGAVLSSHTSYDLAVRALAEQLAALAELAAHDGEEPAEDGSPVGAIPGVRWQSGANGSALRAETGDGRDFTDTEYSWRLDSGAFPPLMLQTSTDAGAGTALLVDPQLGADATPAQLHRCFDAAAVTTGLAGAPYVTKPQVFSTVATHVPTRTKIGDGRAPLVIAGDAAQTGHVFTGQTCFVNLALALGLEPSSSDNEGQHFVLLRQDQPQVALRVERAYAVADILPLTGEEATGFRNDAVIGYGKVRSGPADHDETLSLLDTERLLRPFLPTSPVPGV